MQISTLIIRHLCRFMLFVSLLWSTSVIAQDSFGGYPIGLLQPELDLNKKSSPIQIASLDNKEYTKYGSSSLFALRKAIPTFENEDNWQQVSPTMVRWSASFQMNDQLPIAFVFEDFALPSHCRLFVYSEEGKKVLGAYTSSNNSESGNFMSDLISGETITVELVMEGNDIERKLPFELKDVYQSFIPLDGVSSAMEVDTGFLASRPCHPNANCPDGDLFEEEKRSVCRILMVLEEGLVFCSGTLMNNTLEDQRPLILSAFHCQDYLTPIHDLWRFDFNFITSGCNDLSEPSFDRIIGCRQLAGQRDSDMLLVELNLNVPSAFDVYYAGWNREDAYIPQPAFQLHHPLGDVMKVSVDFDDLRMHNDNISWDNGTRTPPLHHLRCELDVGAHQVGSSGGPLMDEDGRVVGKLHGGGVDSLDCSDNRSFFGRLSVAWEGDGESSSRLSDWLDPLQLNALQIPGLNQGESALVRQVVGQVTLSDGTPLPNVEMFLGGTGVGSTFTDRNGFFILTNVPILAEFSLTPDLAQFSASQGVSSTDVLLAQQSIIGLREYESEIQELAADVSGDGSVSSVDLVQMINVILGLESSFGSDKVWGFSPQQISFPNDEEVQFTAYKIGDVNFSFSITN